MSISRFVNSQEGSDGARSTRVTIVSVIAASVATILAGPFGTHLLPLPARILFWVVLIGWNALKWRLWYRYVPGLLPDNRLGGRLFAVLGAALLNAMLPFEVRFLFSAVGHPQSLPFSGLFVTATIISLSISAVIAVVGGGPAEGPSPVTVATMAPAPLSLPATGIAARADVRDIQAVVAEDHYLRLHFVDGRQTLLLYRFGDAVRELAAIDGQQVHRGAWVAAAAQAKAVRDGRKWRLKLADGTIIAVSNTYLPAVRGRGWLNQ
jgi:hypothetical protein